MYLEVLLAIQTMRFIGGNPNALIYFCLLFSLMGWEMGWLALFFFIDLFII
jgi:hypothetical protein